MLVQNRQAGEFTVNGGFVAAEFGMEGFGGRLV